MFYDLNEYLKTNKLADPWDVVDKFEEMIAEYAGSKYCISIDNCTNALFLCLKYLNATGKIEIPARTYLSVPGAIIHAGCQPTFQDYEWSGIYQLKPYPVYDGATRFTQGMYIPDSFHCLSFHRKKTLGLGKGGCILTNDVEAVRWFKLARYEGRDIKLGVNYDQEPEPTMLGYNMYLFPELALEAIKIFEKLQKVNADCGGSWKYKDISHYKIFQTYDHQH